MYHPLEEGCVWLKHTQLPWGEAGRSKMSQVTRVSPSVRSFSTLSLTFLVYEIRAMTVVLQVAVEPSVDLLRPVVVLGACIALST